MEGSVVEKVRGMSLQYPTTQGSSVSLQRNCFREIPTNFLTVEYVTEFSRWTDAPEVRCDLTDTHTHIYDNYSNPCCACAPRVKEREATKSKSIFFSSSNIWLIDIWLWYLTFSMIQHSLHCTVQLWLSSWQWQWKSDHVAYTLLIFLHGLVDVFHSCDTYIFFILLFLTDTYLWESYLIWNC